jgi:stage V sporulation protein K
LVIVFQIWGSLSRSSTGINPFTNAFEISEDSFRGTVTYKWVISESYSGSSIRIHLITKGDYIEDLVLIGQDNHYGSWYKRGHLGITLLFVGNEKIILNNGQTDYSGSKNKVVSAWTSINNENVLSLLNKGLSKIFIHNTQGDIVIESNVENSKKVIKELNEIVISKNLKSKNNLLSDNTVLNEENQFNEGNIQHETAKNININVTSTSLSNNIHSNTPKSGNKKLVTEDNNQSIEKIIEDLNKLIGLSDVKKEVKSLVNFINFQKQREAKGLKNTELSYHCVFTGSPGTGKTTVARIISQIYHQLGVIDKGHLIEVDRSGLIGEYVGQTSVKVDNVIKKAIGGVLFIDEAYSLASKSESDYGKEAVSTLLKRMEDYRDNLVVIVAGYTNEMKEFIELNPGLESRFNRYIHFNDYKPEELLEIFKKMCKDSDYTLLVDAEAKILEKIKLAVLNSDKSFGNARYIRNIFEKTIENLSNRVVFEKNLSHDLLSQITLADTEF